MPASPPRRIGVVAESTSGETRVAATPDTVRRLIELGYEIVVETGAGAASGFSDVSYVEAGARLDDAWPADVVLKVNAPSHDEVRRLRDGATIVGLLAPAQHSELLTQLANRP